ncbi:MAG: hypothetical protein LBL55_00435, partial [Propionibacteriaceae bacterium]|nr:hypothetical protein [Propionibacteriaceae bacterium]
PDAGNGPAADPAAGDEYEGVAPDDAVLPLSEVGQVADELVRSVLDAEFVRSEQNQSSNHSRGRF